MVHVWACVCAIALSCAGAGPTRNFRHDAPAARGGGTGRGGRGGGGGASHPGSAARRGGTNRPGPSRANIELNREISSGCVSAGDVCACIEARADDFNYVNVATAFRKLLTARRGSVPRSAMESAT